MFKLNDEVEFLGAYGRVVDVKPDGSVIVAFGSHERFFHKDGTFNKHFKKRKLKVVSEKVKKDSSISKKYGVFQTDGPSDDQVERDRALLRSLINAFQTEHSSMQVRLRTSAEIRAGRNTETWTDTTVDEVLSDNDAEESNDE